MARMCEIGSTQAVSMWIRRNEIPHARLMYLRAMRPDIFAAATEAPKDEKEVA